MEVTKAIANYVINLRYNDLPNDVLNWAKLCFLDWLGVTLKGSKERVVDILLQTIEEQGGKAQATILGKSKKTSLLHAALINGTASHALDFDDVHLKMMGHPSAPIFPAILALGEFKNLSGKKFLTAFIAGFETECRIASIVYPDHYLCGWHATGTLGHFGASAGCANLLKLNLSQAVNAMGIAGTQASGLKGVFGTMCKPFHVGKAASNGLLSAILAQKGFTSSQDMLEGEKGFSKTFSKRMEPKKALEALGEHYAIREVIFKRHASCFETHPAIDAILTLKEENSITPDQVNSIELRACPIACDIAGNPDPKNALEAKFSLSFCVALALNDGNAGEKFFNDQKVLDPHIVAIRNKVKVKPDDTLSPSQARIVITKNDGVTIDKFIDILSLSQDQEKIKKELIEKFKRLSVPIVGQKNTEKLIDKIKNLEEVSEVNLITKLCKV